MRLLSVNTASVGNLFTPPSNGRRGVATAIHKQPVAGPVFVERLGLAGDEQADLRMHGGPDKAIYAYPCEHYPFWSSQRRNALKRETPLPFGSMGENLSLQGLLEDQVWVGDRLAIGSVLLEVTAPRQPCFKFNAKMGFRHAAKMMVQAGNSGFYLRVITAGSLIAGDDIALIAGPRQTSIAQINERHRKGHQQDLF